MKAVYSVVPRFFIRFSVLLASLICWKTKKRATITQMPFCLYLFMHLAAMRSRNGSHATALLERPSLGSLSTVEHHAPTTARWIACSELLWQRLVGPAT